LYKQVTAIFITKKPHYICYIFLRIDHSENIVGQDQEFWTADTGKWHFKEQYIWYNCTLFLWAVIG